jgi:hypothetical protein
MDIPICRYVTEWREYNLEAAALPPLPTVLPPDLRIAFILHRHFHEKL